MLTKVHVSRGISGFSGYSKLVCTLAPLLCSSRKKELAKEMYRCSKCGIFWRQYLAFTSWRYSHSNFFTKWKSEKLLGSWKSRCPWSTTASMSGCWSRSATSRALWPSTWFTCSCVLFWIKSWMLWCKVWWPVKTPTLFMHSKRLFGFSPTTSCLRSLHLWCGSLLQNYKFFVTYFSSSYFKDFQVSLSCSQVIKRLRNSSLTMRTHTSEQLHI